MNCEDLHNHKSSYYWSQVCCSFHKLHAVIVAFEQLLLFLSGQSCSRAHWVKLGRSCETSGRSMLASDWLTVAAMHVAIQLLHCYDKPVLLYNINELVSFVATTHTINTRDARLLTARATMTTQRATNVPATTEGWQLLYQSPAAASPA